MTCQLRRFGWSLNGYQISVLMILLGRPNVMYQGADVTIQEEDLDHYQKSIDTMFIDKIESSVFVMSKERATCKNC